jgi:hypothetical protein
MTTIMTFNEARVEEIAREYCRLKGLDPEARVGHGQEGSMMWHYAPRWTLVAEQVRDRLTWDAAMYCDSPSATSTPPPKRNT